MQIYAKPPKSETKALLAACGLPTEDLEAEHFEHFFGCGRKDSPSGVVGIEVHGAAALLRSLAVAENSRGIGCGRRLIAEAEAHAARLGITEIYLLTNTAASLFKSLGYAVVGRESAPTAIRATKEFSALCPASATFMVKRIVA